MSVVERSDNRSLMKLQGSTDDNSRDQRTTNGESISESNFNLQRQSYKSAFQYRKSVISNNSSNFLLLTNNEIGFPKDDSGMYHWNITMDKAENAGI